MVNLRSRPTKRAVTKGPNVTPPVTLLPKQGTICQTRRENYGSRARTASRLICKPNTFSAARSLKPYVNLLADPQHHEDMKASLLATLVIWLLLHILRQKARKHYRNLYREEWNKLPTILKTEVEAEVMAQGGSRV